MRKRNNLRGFEVGFISKEDNSSCGRTNQGTDMWHGEFDPIESLSDPRWHRRKLKDNQLSTDTISKPATIKNARENIKRAMEKKKVTTFPKIDFSDNSKTSRKTQNTEQGRTTKLHTQKQTTRPRGVRQDPLHTNGVKGA